MEYKKHKQIKKWTQIIFVLSFCFLSFASHAQKVEKIRFSRIDSLLHYRNDTTYVMNFWATWCKPCVSELPNFEKLNSEYKNRKVRVILVSLDMPKEMHSRLVPFVQERQLKSHVWLLDAANANEWIDKVSPSWSGSIPASEFYNAKNGKKQFYEQSFSYEELKNTLEKILL